MYTILLLFTFITTCQEYLYPIEQIDNEHVLVMYQKNLHHVELYSWSILTQQATKLLLSRFTPAGVQQMPDKKGFVFFDNAQIKYKHYIKRSAASLEYNDILYDFYPINCWLDNDQFLVSAKANKKVSIYSCNIETKEVSIYKSGKKSDYLFASAINDDVFIITRRKQKKEKFYKIIRHNDKSNQKETLLATTTFGIAFLQMVDAHHGYCIKHALKIPKKEPLHMSYCKIIKTESGWQLEELFIISIPMDLLVKSDFRVHEGIVSFLPRLYGNIILYSSAVGKSLHIFSYNCPTELHKQHTQETAIGIDHFSPLLIGNKIFIGGNITNDRKIWMNEDADTFIQLPMVLL